MKQLAGGKVTSRLLESREIGEVKGGKGSWERQRQLRVITPEWEPEGTMPVQEGGVREGGGELEGEGEAERGGTDFQQALMQLMRREVVQEDLEEVQEQEGEGEQQQAGEHVEGDSEHVQMLSDCRVVETGIHLSVSPKTNDLVKKSLLDYGFICQQVVTNRDQTDRMANFVTKTNNLFGNKGRKRKIRSNGSNTQRNNLQHYFPLV